MIDLVLLTIFSYAIYRMAQSYNITPWKWITRYVVVFFMSLFAISALIVGIYGQNMMKDNALAQKVIFSLEPFIMLYQFVLFFFFRNRIERYVHLLDQVDKHDNDTKLPDPPAKDQKDFSYFR
jgi:p-aminobenzoyl-glutamate transporter AbgT